MQWITICLLAVLNVVCTCVGLQGRNQDALRLLTERILHQPLSGSNDTKHVCCLPGQWESIAYLSSGDVFIDANTFYAFINGTGRIAFDVTEQKSYVKFNMTQLTPLMPQPSHNSRTVIKDYKKGIMYQIEEDGTCYTQNTTKDLTFSCIPESAKKLSSGMIPGHIPVTTYNFRYQEFPVLTSASVQVQGNMCRPLVVNYAVYINNPDSGTLYNLDVLDISPGIKDKSIFHVPTGCQKRHV